MRLCLNWSTIEVLFLICYGIPVTFNKVKYTLVMPFVRKHGFFLKIFSFLSLLTRINYQCPRSLKLQFHCFSYIFYCLFSGQLVSNLHNNDTY